MALKKQINIILLIGVSLSPAIAATIFVIIGVIKAIFKGWSLRESLELLIIIIPASLVAEAFFFVPATASGLIICLSKITKKSLLGILYSILGGVITMAWSIFIRFMNDEDLTRIKSSETESFPYMKDINDLAIFAISTTGIYISILIFTPRKIMPNSESIN